MDKILVPVDLSKHSENVFEFLYELVSISPKRIELTLLCVIEDKPELLGLIGRRKTTKSEWEEIEAQVEKSLLIVASKYLPKIPVKINVVGTKKPIAEEILDISTVGKFSAIAMATHGRTGIKRLLLGSVTERVLAQAEIPVFVVPCRQGCSNNVIKGRRPVNIVALTDFSRSEKNYYSEIKDICDCYNRQGVTLNLLHIIEDMLVASYHLSLGSDPNEIWAEQEEKSLKKLDAIRDKYFFGKPVLTSAIRQAGSIADSALQFAYSHRVNLLIVGKHKRKGIDRLVLGSVAEKIVRYAEQPTLVVPF